jgi:riboflavin biosynthesis pyrimidine reductase
LPEPGAAGAAAATAAGLPALELLYEAPGLPAFELPHELAAAYGGPLGFAEPRVYTNFVATVDGVVAVPSLADSNRLIADASEADRFVLGLLRACCDVLVIGAGTLAASPGSVWTPAQAYPPAAEAFAELRERRGRPPAPTIAVLSGSGGVDPGHPAFTAGALVLTTDGGAVRLAGRLDDLAVVALGGRLDPAAALAALRARGLPLVLSEGGPHTIAPFLAAGLVDELFLTVSPLLAGRIADDPRLALAEGCDLLAGGPPRAALASVRRAGDHLFLRYALAAGRRAAAADPRPAA